MLTVRSALSTTLLLSTCLISPILLTACGGGSSDSTSSTPTTPTPAKQQTLNGVAATGKPFVGAVVVVNAQGDVSAPVTVAVDGSFSVTLPEGAPYLLKAYNSDETLYSYAASASVDAQININQLTTAAVFNGSGKANLDHVFTHWADRAASVNDAAMLVAATQVVFNLNSEMINLGFSPDQIKTLNVFTVSFAPVAGNLFDALLDQVNVDLACGVMACDIAVDVLGQSVTWSSNFNPDQFNISFNIDSSLKWPVVLLGNYQVTATTTIGGMSSDVVLSNVGKPLSQYAFCKSDYLADNFGVSVPPQDCYFSGKTGTYSGVNALGVAYSTKVVYRSTLSL
jgi:hypothetical protein